MVRRALQYPIKLTKLEDEPWTCFHSVHPSGSHFQSTRKRLAQKHGSKFTWQMKKAVLCLFIQLSKLTTVITNSQYKIKNTPRMHRNHVPLNCTDRTIAHIPSLAFPSLPSPLASHCYPFLGDKSWFGCVNGRAGFSSLQEEKGAGWEQHSDPDISLNLLQCCPCTIWTLRLCGRCTVPAHLALQV